MIDGPRTTPLPTHRLSIPLEDPSSTGGGTPLGSIWSSITQAALGLVQQVPFASMAGLPAIQVRQRLGVQQGLGVQQVNLALG